MEKSISNLQKALRVVAIEAAARNDQKILREIADELVLIPEFKDLISLTVKGAPNEDLGKLFTLLVAKAVTEVAELDAERFVEGLEMASEYANANNL